MIKRKIGNLIIIALSSILIISSVMLRAKYQNPIYKPNKELAVTESIELIDIDLLTKKLNEVSKMIILDGEVSIKAKYSNEDIVEDDVNFKWVKGLIEELKSKDLYVDALYQFSYIYDLEDMQIEVVDNVPNIHINKNRLSVSVELNENKTFYTERVGLLENDFTPQEFNSLNARTKDLVYNKMINDSENREKAFSSLKENIDKLLGYECKYIESSYDVLETENEITINKIKN